MARILMFFRFLRAAQSCVTRLFWLLLLLAVLGCGMFSFAAGRASAEGQGVHEIVLVVDHSQ